MLLVPVPLHRSKFTDRGFNQARSLAAAALSSLAKTHPQWRLSLAAKTLMRLRATESQSGLTPRQRRMNVRGAFTVSDPAAVALKHILLIDDIFTTGATARAAAQALLQAGAASVWVATLARARRVTGFPAQEGHHDGMPQTANLCFDSKFTRRPTTFLMGDGAMSLGKAMIHARKQKAIARAAALAADHAGGLTAAHAAPSPHILQMPGAGAQCLR